MSSIELGDGQVVHVAPPVVPSLAVAPASASPVVVLPVAGPKGEQGEPGTIDTPARLEDLVDVDVPAGALGLLERHPDGKVRATPREDVTSEWFTGHGAPGAVSGAGRGDMYLDLDTGQLYQLQ